MNILLSIKHCAEKPTKTKQCPLCFTAKKTTMTKTILSTKQWIEILKNPEITKELGLKILETLLEYPNYKAFASEIGLKLGYTKSPQSPLNLEIGRFGKRIAKYYDIDITIRENQKYKFWDIFFLGEDIGSKFLWILRPEIVDAFKRINTQQTNTNPQKIARICWNYYNWTKPSGKEGKSLNKDLYEYKTGFGHEEWLFDFDKQINDYHYAFLQPINAHLEKYQNKIFDISLYSIDNSTKKRWWLGKIKNVVIISAEETKTAYKIYKKNGWLKEMTKQLKIIDADYKVIENDTNLFNVKFRQSDCNELLDLPLLISDEDKTISATYYTTLLNKKSNPVLDITEDFIFTAKHNPQKRNSTANYGKRLSEINKLHPKIQDFCYQEFVSQFGEQNVGTEQSTGYGTFIDLVVKHNSQFTFFEIKTNNSIRICIREALSQLLEYGHFPDKNNATKFVIISQNTIDRNTKKYLNNLRLLYKIPIYYRQFDLKELKLTNEEH